MFRSLYEALINDIDEEPIKEKQCNIMLSLLDYNFKGIQPDYDNLSGIERSIIRNAIPLIDNHVTNSRNGQKGGRPKKPPIKPPLKTPQQNLYDIKGNDNDIKGKENDDEGRGYDNDDVANRPEPDIHNTPYPVGVYNNVYLTDEQQVMLLEMVEGVDEILVECIDEYSDKKEQGETTWRNDYLGVKKFIEVKLQTEYSNPLDDE